MSQSRAVCPGVFLPYFLPSAPTLPAAVHLSIYLSPFYLCSAVVTERTSLSIFPPNEITQKHDDRALNEHIVLRGS